MMILLYGRILNDYQQNVENTICNCHPVCGFKHALTKNGFVMMKDNIEYAIAQHRISNLRCSVVGYNSTVVGEYYNAFKTSNFLSGKVIRE